MASSNLHPKKENSIPMFSKLLVSAVLTLAFSIPSASQMLPPSPPTSGPTPFTGTQYQPEGYYHWQYGIYSHTAQFIMESGLTQSGLHQFTILLPQTISIHEIHATHDFAPWCMGSGYEVLLNASTPSSLDALIGDKTFSGGQAEIHTPLNANFSAIAAGIPMQSLTFNYFLDNSCTMVTDSLVVNMVIN